jgi:hypothetical protein
MALPPEIGATTNTGRHGAVVGAIADAARATGVDFSYLLGQARIESGLNPTARARTSSATGLYQFIDQSWLAVVDRHGERHGLGGAAAAITQGADGRYRVVDASQRAAIMALRNDPVVAARMAAEHAADNRAYLESRTGRTAAPVDLYLAHFLGAGGASRFLRAHSDTPGAIAAAMFPRAAAANRSVFYDRGGAPRSLDAVRNLFAQRLGAASGAAGPAATPEPAPDDDATREVQPADWLRLSRAMPNAASLGEGMAGSARLSLPFEVDPARARLAYMLLSGAGA